MGSKTAKTIELYHLLWLMECLTTTGGFVPSKMLFRNLEFLNFERARVWGMLKGVQHPNW